jgi:hypothetical protein
MKQTRIYNKPFGYIGFWDWENLKEHKTLINKGYKVIEVETTKDWDTTKTCCLALVFLPLALIGRTTHYKVTYERN